MSELAYSIAELFRHEERCDNMYTASYTEESAHYSDTRQLPAMSIAHGCDLSPTPMATEARRLLIPMLLIVAVGVFYLTTIRMGHNWGDDFAMYIQEAADITHYISYTQSNYIVNPRNPTLGPPIYPPVYPLLLSPVYLHFGLNFTAMKVENILLFVFFLMAFCILVKDTLRLRYLVGTTALVGLSPVYWELKDNVVAEAAYLCLLYCCLLALKSAYRATPLRSRIVTIIASGVLVYLCYGTRTMGLLLVPALLLYEIHRSRRFPKIAAAVGLIFAIGWALQQKTAPSERGYLQTTATTHVGLQTVVENSIDYTKELSGFWDNGYQKALRIFPLVAFSAVALLGYSFKFKTNNATVAEYYAPLHLALILVWPIRGGERFLVPIFPLYIYYACVGVQALGTYRSRQLEKYLCALLIFSAGLTYVGAYSKKSLGPMPEGIGKRETVDFFQYVRTRTNAREVFIFTKPRALGLLGERKASIYPISGSDEQIWDYMSSVSARYLIKGPMDDPFWNAFLQRNSSKLLETYSNRDFTVYKIPDRSGS